jgi:hypothetical protein
MDEEAEALLKHGVLEGVDPMHKPLNEALDDLRPAVPKDGQHRRTGGALEDVGLLRGRCVDDLQCPTHVIRRKDAKVEL